MVAHLQTTDTTPDQLAELMVGRPVQAQKQWHKADKGAAIVKVKDLHLNSTKNQTLISDINFTVHEGEILGIAGVAGNGQSELLNILAGITAPTRGQIIYHDHQIDIHTPADPKKIKSLGVAHVPEDRHASGIVLPFTAAENAALGYEKEVSGHYGHSFLSPKSLRARCINLMQRFDVRPADPDLKSSLFSGGNQQKLVLAREMSAAPSILLIGQPTRGVDIGAIEFIHQQLIDMRDKGCAIILVSVELDEIMSLSDRIMVMNNGAIMGLIDRATANVKDIGLLMAGIWIMRRPLPAWADISIMPLINIAAAFVVAGVIIALIGENPFTALSVMVKGAFVYKGALGYTLYYTTNFIFTGLAVAVAFHAMLFNIGGEGQAMIGGLGIGFIVLSLDLVLPPLLVVLLAIPVAAIFGAIWGIIPGWLQARRGSHIVITTIMFNFIASSIMVWLLAGMLMAPGQMSPQTRDFADGGGADANPSYCKCAGLAHGAFTAEFVFWYRIAGGGGGMGAHLAHTAGLYYPRHWP